MKAFTSFAGMATEFASLMVRMNVTEHEALETACIEIEKRAKQKIGDYQESAGPFAAWPSLAESTKADRVAMGYPEDEPGLRSGAMRDSIEHRVARSVGYVGSDDDHLLWFELGTVKQPARSVLGGAAFELEPEIRKEIGLEFTAYLAGASYRKKVT
jgi:hypothetical protein